MMKFLLVLLLMVPMIGYSQSGNCDLPKAKVKVVRANNVIQNGMPIQKGDFIQIDKAIPGGVRIKLTKEFFECNKLVFEKNGELIYRYDGELVNNEISYHDFSQLKSHSNTNLSSRGENTNLEAWDCSQKSESLNLLSLFEKEKTLGSKECLENYFYDNYWLTGRDVLILESSFFDKLVFSSEEGEFVFTVEEDKLEIESGLLPETDWFDIYILKENEPDLVSENVYLINLNKTVERLKKAGFANEEIHGYINQNLLFFDRESLTDEQRDKLNRILLELTD